MAHRATFFLLAGIILSAGLAGLFSPGAVRAGAPILPRPITAKEAAQLMKHPPAGFEVVDIRPAAEYADYALPGSLNLDAATVLGDETLLAGQAPLLLVDKDGATAFAVAGQLAPKTSRPVMALTGGMIAWWKATEPDRAANPAASANASDAPPAAPAPDNQAPGKGGNS